MFTKILLSLALVLAACTGGVRTCAAQAPNQHAAPVKLLTAVDTANIVVVAPRVYGTWIYALATPTSWPSSAIYVLFNCKARKVARMYHIVYKMRDDSLGVTGPIVEDKGEWVDVSVPKTFDLVCRVGAEKEADYRARDEYDREHDIQPHADPHPDWRQA